jgi:P4 family phage/plasmid primase-like protien
VASEIFPEHDAKAKKPDLEEIRKAAHYFIGRGLVPLPLPGGKKRPLLDGWQTAVIGADQVDSLFHEGCNIGLRLDTLTDIDLDAPEARALAQYFLKQTSARWGRDTSRNSHHLYIVDNSRYEKFEDPLAEGENRTLLEIRHDSGHQSMIPPSVHPDTGEQIRWEGSGVFKPEPWNYHELRRAAGRIAAGALLCRYLEPGKRQFTWLYLSGAMKRAEWTLDDALNFAKLVSSLVRDEKIPNRIQAVTRTFEQDEEVGGLKKLEEFLPKPVIRKLADWLDLRRTQSDPLDLTDDSNAQSLFTEHGEDLRYLPNEGKGGLWVRWNDVIWQRDRMGLVTDVAGKSLKKKADQLTAESRDARLIEKVKRELLNMPGITAALDRLSCYPEIATPSSAFDSNPWLVGLTNGIYNLKLDRLEEGMREHLVSRQMPAAFDKDSKCTRWTACLERAQADLGVRDFLQRLAGACLIGMQTEHGFIFNYGKGANFKTAYSEVVRRVMGDDYAATPNEELFFKGNQDVPRNYVADIHGMRLLTTNEKNEGSEWNIEFIKRLLGGQQLNACRKYCEAFSFVPSARIIAAANNKPRLNELDEALRRRFLLIPWDVTIPEDGEQLSSTETDPETILRCLKNGSRIPFERLMALLLEERDGILNWMLAGAREFIARGLRLEPPASVKAATENYFADEDIMGRFVKDWCATVAIPSGMPDPQVVRLLQKDGSSSEILHGAFSRWSQFGKHAWGKRKVTQRLEKVKDVIARRGTGNRVFLNLSLNDAAKEAMAPGPGLDDLENALF